MYKVDYRNKVLPIIIVIK